MKATMLIFALVVVGLCIWCAIAPAQFAVGVGGWDSGYHASTAAEGALTGMANAISAQGQYNLSTSEAAINMEEAQRRDIENRGKWTDTYFEMRRVNKAYHDSLKKPATPRPRCATLRPKSPSGWP